MTPFAKNKILTAEPAFKNFIIDPPQPINSSSGAQLLLRFFVVHYSVQPPSTIMFWPVTYLDSSENRNLIGPTKSSGSPILDNGILFLSRLIKSLLSFLTFNDGKAPGLIIYSYFILC